MRTFLQLLLWMICGLLLGLALIAGITLAAKHFPRQTELAIIAVAFLFIIYLLWVAAVEAVKMIRWTIGKILAMRNREPLYEDNWETWNDADYWTYLDEEEKRGRSA